MGLAPVPGDKPPDPALQAVRGVLPLSFAERVANSRAAAKIKWNTPEGKAWRAAYAKSPKGVATRRRYWVSLLAQRTLARWREANVARMRATEARCRAKYRANLKLAQEALAAGINQVDLPQGQRRAFDALRQRPRARREEECQALSRQCVLACGQGCGGC